jgi:hypothetical protein
MKSRKTGVELSFFSGAEMTSFLSAISIILVSIHSYS